MTVKLFGDDLRSLGENIETEVSSKLNNTTFHDTAGKIESNAENSVFEAIFGVFEVKW
jgi:hypothetical protein